MNLLLTLVLSAFAVFGSLFFIVQEMKGIAMSLLNKSSNSYQSLTSGNNATNNNSTENAVIHKMAPGFIQNPRN